MRYPLICEAITKGLALSVYYDQKSRTIEAYAYGETKEGNEILRAWQTSPWPAEWKLFRIDKIGGLLITQTKVGIARSDYNRADPVMSRIFCER